jgi:hypothetical protein
MMIEWGRNQGNPRHCLGLKARYSERDVARGRHQGHRSTKPREQAGHMTANHDDQNYSKITLAGKRPSTHA